MGSGRNNGGCVYGGRADKGGEDLTSGIAEGLGNGSGRKGTRMAWLLRTNGLCVLGGEIQEEIEGEQMTNSELQRGMRDFEQRDEGFTEIEAAQGRGLGFGK
ncbi:unnamed protein product [Calypogeia fissa]